MFFRSCIFGICAIAVLGSACEPEVQSSRLGGGTPPANLEVADVTETDLNPESTASVSSGETTVNFAQGTTDVPLRVRLTRYSGKPKLQNDEALVLGKPAGDIVEVQVYLPGTSQVVESSALKLPFEVVQTIKISSEALPNAGMMLQVSPDSGPENRYLLPSSEIAATPIASTSLGLASTSTYRVATYLQLSWALWWPLNYGPDALNKMKLYKAAPSWRQRTSDDLLPQYASATTTTTLPSDTREEAQCQCGVDQICAPTPANPNVNSCQYPAPTASIADAVRFRITPHVIHTSQHGSTVFFQLHYDPKAFASNVTINGTGSGASYTGEGELSSYQYCSLNGSQWGCSTTGSNRSPVGFVNDTYAMLLDAGTVANTTIQISMQIAISSAAYTHEGFSGVSLNFHYLTVNRTFQISGDPYDDATLIFTPTTETTVSR